MFAASHSSAVASALIGTGFLGPSSCSRHACGAVRPSAAAARIVARLKCCEAS